MSDALPVDPSPPVHWTRLHAYGLPEGSVRALLALLVFGTIWGLLLMVPGRDLPDYLKDLLFIIMGHYFAVRGRAEPGEIPGPPPLFLPRGSVRLLLVAGFIVVGVLLYRHGQLTAIDKNPGVVTLVLVAGFLLGVVLRRIAVWWHSRGHRVNRVVEDLRASISLLAAVLLLLLVWNQVVAFLPPQVVGGPPFQDLRRLLGRSGPETVLTAIVGFYFGSRS